MEKYLPRSVDSKLARMLAGLPALMILGPRAVGKTTTAVRHASHVMYLNRPRLADAVRADVDTALEGLPEPVLLDEWQEVPDLLGAVKRSVDADLRPGRYLLTGSVHAHLKTKVWPGTGRVVPVAMYPMTVAEMMGRTTRPLLDRLLAGERPAPSPDSPDLRGYVELALRGGFPPTLGIDAAAVLRDSDLLGRLLDTFVAAQLRSESVVAESRPRLYHLRTHQGRHEVDIVAELRGRRIVGIEITANSSHLKEAARSLAWLRDHFEDRFEAGVVLHTGPASYPLGDRISAAPISTLWS